MINFFGLKIDFCEHRNIISMCSIKFHTLVDLVIYNTNLQYCKYKMNYLCHVNRNKSYNKKQKRE